MSSRFIEVVMLSGEYTTVLPYSEQEYERLLAAQRAHEAIEFTNLEGISYALRAGELDLLMVFTREQIHAQAVRGARESHALDELVHEVHREFKRNKPQWD